MKTVRARGFGIAFAVCSLAGAAGLAHAQSDGASPCAAITDDKSRLQCYDAEASLKRGARPSTAAPASAPVAAPAQPAPAQTTAPAAAATTAPAPAPKAAAPAAATKPALAAAGSGDTEFGSEMLRKKAKPGDPEQPSEITAKVSAVAGKRKGDYRITLDNGQVWAETQRTGGEAPAPGDTITLRRGAMGSYFLSKGSGLALRVKRVQ